MRLFSSISRIGVFNMAGRYRGDREIKANPLNREEADYRASLIEQDAERFAKMVGYEKDKQYALDVAMRVADEIMQDIKPQRVSANVLDSEVL
jgi:hypothetical protein